MLEAENRTPEALLTWLPAIHKAPYKYDFHTVVRSLECAYHQAPRLGDSLQPNEDLTRLSQHAFLHCPGHDVYSFRPAAGKKPAQLSAYLFGLFGPNGPLPIHITEYIRQRKLQDKDPSAAAFLNIFHHRLLSFYYRAWADTEPVTQLDRPKSSLLNTLIHSLSGSHSEKNIAEKKDKQGEFSYLEQYQYIGHLSARHAPPEGLTAILSDYFSFPFDLQQFIPRWVNTPKEDRCYLGKTPLDTKQLGRSMVIGEKVLSAQHQLTIFAYPPSFERFCDFLPNGPKDLNTLIKIVKRYLGNAFNWQLTFRLKPEQTPQWQLGQDAYLGWTLWLTSPRLITQRLLKSKTFNFKKTEDYCEVSLNPINYRAINYP